jgi:tetratricopeptide (TPR) repeat protein
VGPPQTRCALRTGQLSYSLAAGNEATGLFATRVAITHFETAWQLAEKMGWPDDISGADRQGLYAGLGRAYELTEAWLEAQATYQAMIAYAESIGAAAMLCLGLNRMATVYNNGFKDPQRAIALLEQALKVSEQSGDRRGLAETQWNLSVATRMQHKPDLAIARQLSHPQLLARCLNSLAYIHSLLRQWDTVGAYAKEARDLYAAAGDRVLEADSQRVIGWSQIYTGQPRASLDTLQETFAFSRQIENLWGQAECAWRLACTMTELGRYGEAIKLARQAVKQARMVGQPPMVLMALITLGTVQRTLLAFDAARVSLLDALAKSHEKSLTTYQDWALAELCALHASSGDWSQAQVYARQTLQSVQDKTLLPMSFSGWYLTEALLRGGDSDLARAEVERVGKILGDNRRFRIPWLHSQAELAQWDGDPERAITLLQAAMALARQIGLPGEEGSILGTLGELYSKQGHQEQAHQFRSASAALLLHLADSIDEQELRGGFLAAGVVRQILDAD